MTRWWRQAACADTDTELFFSRAPGAKSAAVRVCKRCPVQRECLADVMAAEQLQDGEHPIENLKRRHGIFAGLTAWQRWSSVYPDLVPHVQARNRRHNERTVAA